MNTKYSKTQIAYAIIASTLLIVVLGPELIEGRTHQLLSAPQMCPIDDGNVIGILLFIKDSNVCFEACERKEECRYFRYDINVTIYYFKYFSYIITIYLIVLYYIIL